MLEINTAISFDSMKVGKRWALMSGGWNGKVPGEGKSTQVDLIAFLSLHGGGLVTTDISFKIESSRHLSNLPWVISNSLPIINFFWFSLFQKTVVFLSLTLSRFSVLFPGTHFDFIGLRPAIHKHPG